MIEIELTIAAIAYACGVNIGSPDFSKSAEYKSVCIEKVVNCSVELGGNIERDRLSMCIKKHTTNKPQEYK